MKKQEVFEIRNTNIVSQSNFLIRGKNDEPLTITEQKILYSVISLIQPTDTDLVEYCLDARELYNLIGVDKKTSTSLLKETAEKLVRRAVELPTSEKNPNNWSFVSLLSSCEYIDYECELRITISPKLKPFLLELKGAFTSYQLFHILKLKRAYSISLYQLLKSYQFQKIYTVSVEELREILSINAKSYKVYSDLKNKVLLNSIKEINEKTDLFIEFVEHRKKRKVEFIDFIININKNIFNEVIINNLGEAKEFNSQLVNLLKGNNIELNFEFKKTEEVWRELAFKIWGEEIGETKLFDVVWDLLLIENINNYLAFITSQLRKYLNNVERGYEWDYGLDEGIKKREIIPEWFYKTQIEKNIKKESE